MGVAGYTDGQLIDLAVKYSKRSLNQLDTMKEDVLKCRKNDTLRKKFKSYSVSMEDDMYSHKGGITLRAHLTPERPRNLIFSQFGCKWMRLEIS